MIAIVGNNGEQAMVMSETIDRVVAGHERMFAPVEVAAILGYKQATVQEMCRDGRIKAKKIGTQWRVPESELRRFIEEGPAPGEESK